ncbi:MAG TPA: hypothetical protein VKR58_01860, partial [Aquella sp.]|nr:hypothetical protein [Aquella sp.]
MFKNLIRSFALKVYDYGKVAERIRELDRRNTHLKNSVTIDESSWIYEKSEIDNYQNDSSK